MTVGTCRVELHLAGNNSLKGKRRVVKSIKDRIRGRFNVSVAEVDRLDEWQRATLGIACISNSSRLVDETLTKVVNLIETDADALILDYAIDLVTQ
ncbi:hypothetical protein MELA_00806 [Candidatus Methylomirabilis lanthanidiphila]|uniref:DUF503 domain-containing protein n=1 Tax=Candidatus Methylomirabilis lanthanidiphila TaxID=2211376 RepID=A0A564ZGK7_9BACT|nr:DUF503 domain-containing protein [Candidatus Methylomirabilis lanthanidiphila]VUZ84435.1 hypothetical protein MELA_00806 [Candidatus Methylomirabilis lanthanidiphila]